MIDPCGESPPVSNVPLYVLAGLLALLIAYELLAPHWGLPTISQYFSRKFGGRAWWKVLGATIVGLAIWHLLFGGPL